MNPYDLTADKITQNNIQPKVLDGYSFHFFQCKSWLDLAKRTNGACAVRYAAFELRYGIEYLLFELLVLTSESLGKEEYEACIGNAGDIKKKLGKKGTDYEKLSEFTDILLKIASGPRVQCWKIDDLFESWGIASSFLHFDGIHSLTYLDKDWITQSINKLTSAIEPIWRAITETQGVAIFKPSKMQPDVFKTWEEFKSGAISRDDLIVRMKLRFPITDLKLRDV